MWSVVVEMCCEKFLKTRREEIPVQEFSFLKTTITKLLISFSNVRSRDGLKKVVLFAPKTAL